VRIKWVTGLACSLALLLDLARFCPLKTGAYLWAVVSGAASCVAASRTSFTDGDLGGSPRSRQLRNPGVRSDLVDPGHAMVELHSNFTIDGSKTIVDGVYPTNHAEHVTVEITPGFNDW
jgi:hypothetical protein